MRIIPSQPTGFHKRPRPSSPPEVEVAALPSPCPIRRRRRMRLAGLFLSMVFLWWAEPALQAAKPPTQSRLAFSPPGGIRTNAFEVTVSAPAGSEVRYTTDGSQPGPGSPGFTAPIRVDRPTWLRACRVVNGVVTDEASGFYAVLGADLAVFSSNLPLILLQTPGTEPSRDAKIPAAMWVIPRKGDRASLTGTPDYAGTIALNIRGRASLRYPKRSYTVKLVDEAGEDRPAALLGLPKDEDFVLYAPYPDKTLMRDVLAYEMSREMGHWAPRTRFAEVFVTQGREPVGMEDYVGVYVLEERIKRGSSRVDITKLTPAHLEEPAISGGYIFKKDHMDRGYYGPPDLLGGGSYTSSGVRPGFPTGPGGFPADPAGFLPTVAGSASSRDGMDNMSSSTRRPSTRRTVQELLTRPSGGAETPGGRRSVIRTDDEEEIVESQETGFVTSRTNQFYWVEPEEDEVTPVQREWLKRHLDRFEKALMGPDFRDPSKGYPAYLDARSFIDYHWLVEVTKNVDGHRFSTFYTKDRGGKIRLEPVWDWNLSFGNANGKQGWIAERWLWPQLSDSEYLYFRRLFEDPDFAQQYVDRWGTLRQTVFSADRVAKRIQELAAQLKESQERNFVKWPILGKLVNPNYFAADTYAEEVEWMQKWILQRLDWIGRQFVPEPSGAFEPALGGQQLLRWKDPAGEVFVTMDGSDPRASGGAPASTAKAAGEPFKVAAGATIKARARRDNRWSPLVSITAP